MAIFKKLRFFPILLMSLSAITCFSVLGAGATEDVNADVIKIHMSFNDTVIEASLYDNATTRALVEKMPFSLPMRNMYSREMVYRFPEPLPTDLVTVRGYEVGEIVYYPPLHSFVILYAQNNEHFSMQGLGWIHSGLDSLKDTENVIVTIKLEKSDS